MSLKLTPLVKGSGPTVVLQRPVYLVGRHPECDLRLETPKISRRHCCFALAYDRLVIRDLGSRNGIRVNGRDVVETQLFRGDEVAIGPIIYRIEQDTVAGPPRVDPASQARPEIDLVPLDDV